MRVSTSPTASTSIASPRRRTVRTCGDGFGIIIDRIGRYANMRQKLRLGVVYDFRNPPGSGLSHPALYEAIVEQVAWLDGLGLDLVWFTEHHFIEDGYLPSWIPVAAAMASRTRHVRFSSDVCLLPFNHPVRLAEDLAVLDNLSNGRVEIGVGMGYAPHEFRGFGIPLPQRLSRMEESLEVLRRCFAGERVRFHGRRL